MELRSYHKLCVSLSIPIMVSIGLSAAADEIYIRDVSLRNLLCEDRAVQSTAIEQLRAQVGAEEDPHTPLYLSDQEVEHIVEGVDALYRPLPKRVQRRSGDIDTLSARLFACEQVTRDVLCRCPNRKALSFALEHALVFDVSCSSHDLKFIDKWLGYSLIRPRVQGVAVGSNQILTALLLSEEATPELILDLIASGEAQPPKGSYRFGQTGGDMKHDFVVAASYLIARKLDTRRCSGKTGLIRAEELPIPDEAPAASLAHEVRSSAATLLATMTEDSESGS